MADKTGRPKKSFDLTQVEQLASLQCTDEEIAAVLGVCRKTINNRKNDDPDFLLAYTKGKELGKVSLRREQWRAAQNGNIAMLIWLGKQLLGQRDVRHLGEDTSAPFRGMEIAAKNTLEKVLDMAEEDPDES